MFEIQANVEARQYLGYINVLHAIRRSSRLDETARSPILLLYRKEACATEGKITGWKLEILKKFSYKYVKNVSMYGSRFIVCLFL